MTIPPAAAEARASQSRSEEWFRRRSCGLSVDRFFEEDIDLVAERGAGLAHGTDRQFQNRSGADANCCHPPGPQFLLQMNDDALAIEVHNINREAHGKRVHAMTGS